MIQTGDRDNQQQHAGDPQGTFFPGATAQQQDRHGSKRDREYVAPDLSEQPGQNFNDRAQNHRVEIEPAEHAEKRRDQQTDRGQFAAVLVLRPLGLLFRRGLCFFLGFCCHGLASFYARISARIRISAVASQQ